MSKMTTFLKGLAIGAGMSIPGVSGGTMAIILGVYNKLLKTVSNIIKEPKISIPFLCLFALGGSVGLISAAFVISFVLDSPAEIPIRFAFLGAAAGCIPPIMKEAKLKPVTVRKILWLVSGICAAVLIWLIPEGLFSSPSDDIGGFLMKVLGGLIVAVALVLPGVSASQMLYVLGMYEKLMADVSSGSIISLIPLAVGLALGVFITARLLSAAFEKCDGVYLAVLGFLIFSLKDLIPRWSSTPQLLLGIISAAIGFALTFILSRKEKKAEHQAVDGKNA